MFHDYQVSKLRASPTAWPRGYRAGSLSVSSQQCFVFIATGPCCFKLEKHSLGKWVSRHVKGAACPPPCLHCGLPAWVGLSGRLV